MSTRAPDTQRAAAEHKRSHFNLAVSSLPDPLEIVGRYVKGEHPLMRELRALIVRRVAGSDPIVFVGESGTGKRMAVLGLHHAGPRRGRPLVLASLGSYPASLAQSELFGHKKGAFTGADRDRDGLFAEARGSTILLDDISDYPKALQAMILEVVEYGLVRPLGSNMTEACDTRIVATANRSLISRVREGKFREDLYYRLSGGEIRLPPLRDHLSDLPMYAGSYLLDQAIQAGTSPRMLSDGALNLLCEHDWPGNVRELHNVLSRALHSTDSEVLEPDDVAREIRTHVSPIDKPQHPSSPREVPSEEASLRQALEDARWNVTRAAKALGFGRTRMYERMARYHIAR